MCAGGHLHVVPLPEPTIDLALIDAPLSCIVSSAGQRGDPRGAVGPTPLTGPWSPPHNEEMVIEPALGVGKTPGPPADVETSREPDAVSRRRESEHWNRRRD